MPVVKRIICLANSRKLAGRCLAGKEVIGNQPGGWVRPVSEREHQEVSEYERQYKDGRDPQVLDVMDVPLFHPVPEAYQQENWLLDPDHYWVRVERFAWSRLLDFCDPEAPLWLNGYKTYNGVNDRIPLSVVGRVKSSLRLIHVGRISLSVFAPGEAFGDLKRRVQGRFRYHNNEYRLRVTDPVYETAYLAKEDGEYNLSECFLTISLGEPYKGFCYKLIAAIIEPEGE